MLDENYRYDRLDDALNYARFQQATSPTRTKEAFVPQLARLALPSEFQRSLMGPLGITRQDGRYRYGDYRYDQVADAFAYAQLTQNIIPHPS